ncbi:MAG: hypothetical protein AB1345_09610 [Chloroflexota bacterium]
MSTRVNQPSISEGWASPVHGSVKREWVWALAWMAVVLSLTTIPYIVGYAVETSEEKFFGAVFNRQDYAVHLATMQLGARGEWAYRMTFTSEAHEAAYVKLAYIFLGQVARLMGMDLPVMYQVGRLVFGLAAGVAIYALLLINISELKVRRWALLIILLGSGLGWLQWLGGWLPQKDISPIDFWLIDGYVFFSLLTLPHFAAVIALLAGMLAFFLHYLRKPNVWKAVAAGLCSVLILPIQPHSVLLGDLALAGAVSGVLWQRRKWVWSIVLAWMGICALQLPLFLYNLLVFRQPVWHEFMAQNVTLSPPWVYILWGFGLFWPLALIGAWDALRRRDIAGISALVWVVGGLVLLYFPWNLQRRMLLGFTLPLGLLAALGLQALYPRWSVKGGNMMSWLLVGLMSISSLYLSLGSGYFVTLHPDELYDPGPLVQGVDWLAEQAKDDDLVCAAEATGQLVAARTGLKVYLGHPIETLDVERKAAEVKQFFSGVLPITWLQTAGCDWLVYGPYEKVLGDGVVGYSQVLKLRYRREQVQVFEVGP